MFCLLIFLFLCLNIPEYVWESPTECNIDQCIVCIHSKWWNPTLNEQIYHFAPWVVCKGSWVEVKLCHGHRVFGCYPQSAPDQRENCHVWKAWIQTQCSTEWAEVLQVIWSDPLLYCVRELFEQTNQNSNRQIKPLTANTICGITWVPGPVVGAGESSLNARWDVQITQV